MRDITKKTKKEVDEDEFEVELIDESDDGDDIDESDNEIRDTTSSQPRIKEIIQIDRFGVFEGFRYELENVKNKNDLYDLIKLAVESSEGAPYISLFYKMIGSNKIFNRGVTINPEFSDDKEDFMDRIEEIESGEVEGSDPVNFDQYRLVLNFFDLRVVRGLTGFGKNDFCLFKNDNIDGGKDGKCGYLSLLKCCEHLKNEKAKKKIIKLGYKHFQKLKNINKLIDDESLDIGVMDNTIALNNWKEVMNRKKNRVCITLNKKKKKYKRFKLTPIIDSDIKKPKIETLNDAYIIVVGDHYTSCKGYPVIVDNLKVDNSQNLHLVELKNEFFKKWQVVKSIKTITRNYLRKQNIRTKRINTVESKTVYIFFDYETVISWKDANIMKQYSVSFLPMSEKDFKILSTMKEEEKRKFYKDNCKFYYGFDCGKNLIEYFEKNRKNTKFIFTSFNGSNFDNYLLMSDFNKYSDVKTSNYFFNKGKLMDFQIDFRHSLFDVHNHLVGSLKFNCDGFGLTKFKKKSFDHRKIQKLYDDGELEEYLKNNMKELEEYNNYDVICLSILYDRYRNAIVDGSGKKYTELYKFRTMGSLVRDFFDKNLEQKKIKLEVFGGEERFERRLKYKIYIDMIKYRTGGRCDLLNGPKIIHGRVVSIDICSAYPYVCCVGPYYFPTGKMIFYKKGGYKYDDSRIGFFYCDIDQSNLIKKNLPNIIAEKVNGCNDWNTKNVLKRYLISTIKIKKLLDLGCGVVTYEGFYFEKKIKNIELFGYLHKSLKVKNQQDKYKISKDEKYNPAIRSSEKLKLNSISGKMSEGVHPRTIKEVNLSTFQKITEDKKTKVVKEIFIKNGHVFCDYERIEKTLMDRSKPIYIGTLIYDYAQLYLYEKILEPIGKKDCHYADTDSVKINYDTFLKWKKTIGQELVPHWEELEKVDPRYKTHRLYEEKSKVFGSFEDELDENNNYNVYIAKKNYLSTSTEKESHKHFEEEIRFKGVSKKNIVVDINDGLKYGYLRVNYFKKSTLKYSKIGNKFYEVKRKKGKEILKIVEPVNVDHLDMKLNIINDEKAYNYYSENENRNIENNAKDFFDKIFKNGSAFVLCESFKKDLRRKKENNKDFGTIKMSLTIKKITKQINYNKMKKKPEKKEEDYDFHDGPFYCKCCEKEQFDGKTYKKHCKTKTHKTNHKKWLLYGEVFEDIILKKKKNGIKQVKEDPYNDCDSDYDSDYDDDSNEIKNNFGVSWMYE